MSSSALKQLILTPIVVSSAVFVTLTLPLNVLGSKPVAVQVQGEPLFFGELREFAPQYLGLTGVMSVGTGIIGMALTGWQQSSRKSAEVENKILAVKQKIQEKQQLIESFNQAKAPLETFTLNQFLDEAVTEELTLAVNPETEVGSNSVSRDEIGQENPSDTFKVEEKSPLHLVSSQRQPTSQNYTQEIAPIVEPLDALEPQPLAPPQHVKVQAIAKKFASAQTFLGYTQAKDAAKLSLVESSPTTAIEAEELDTQLQQMMERITFLRKAIHSNPQAVNSVKRETNNLHQNFLVDAGGLGEVINPTP